MTAEPHLVADIGGTNARFALADARGRISEMRSYRSKEFASLEGAADAYFSSMNVRPRKACFAAAGPVTDPVIEFTNSPWVLDVAAMRARFGFAEFLVVNDFKALAAGVSELAPSDFAEVKAGTAESSAPMLVIGPGTGFGQALIAPMKTGGRTIIPTEGGHVGFAPRDEDEMAILRFIARDHSRVSLERVVSGGGIVNIYRSLCARDGLQAQFDEGKKVTDAALAGSDAIAQEAITVFCALLGAAAGDAVLATGARGGVVLGGGILPKIKETFLKSRFIERFCDKGRMRDYMEAVPVRLILHDGAALIGASVLLREQIGALRR